MDGYRIEHDSMGEVEVPEDALWRAQTQRAVQNFPISGAVLEDEHVKAMARVKAAAAKVNADLGVITAEQGDAIRSAAAEIVAGEHLVHVHVRGRAGAGLEHVDRERVVVVTADDLVGAGSDRLCLFLRDDAELRVDAGC